MIFVTLILNVGIKSIISNPSILAKGGQVDCVKLLSSRLVFFIVAMIVVNIILTVTIISTISILAQGGSGGLCEALSQQGGGP